MKISEDQRSLLRYLSIDKQAALSTVIISSLADNGGETCNYFVKANN